MGKRFKWSIICSPTRRNGPRQGQIQPLVSGAATFANLPQAPRLARTYAIYVNSSPAPTSGSGYTITEQNNSQLSLTFSGASTTPFGSSGSNWYELGTVTVAANDANPSLKVSYAGSASVTQVVCLQQTSSTVYDPMDLVQSQTDGLNRATVYGYNNLEQQTSTAQGQILPIVSGNASFTNLPLAAGQTRAYTVYAQSTSAPSGYNITDNGTGQVSWNNVGTTSGLLGSGWYEMCTVTVQGGDNATTLNFTGLGSATNICLVQPPSLASYTTDAQLSTETNPVPDLGQLAGALSAVDNSIFDVVGALSAVVNDVGQVASAVWNHWGNSVNWNITNLAQAEWSNWKNTVNWGIGDLAGAVSAVDNSVFDVVGALSAVRCNRLVATTEGIDRERAFTKHNNARVKFVPAKQFRYNSCHDAPVQGRTIRGLNRSIGEVPAFGKAWHAAGGFVPLHMCRFRAAIIPKTARLIAPRSVGLSCPAPST